ncbi:hypothetical protein L208DRAFT_1381810 [Tricholoma matsutake]|nr:hypothetical protein L208DRAFT_1381810 [Tricholoma matsutake 945]
MEDPVKHIDSFIDEFEAEMLASAKFVGKCYMSNFQIQYPTFYEQASSVMKQGKSPSVALEALLNINILDVNNNDPTRYGPARCLWYCVPGTDDWSAPLDEAILTFKLYSGWDKEAMVMALMNHSMVPDLLKSYDSLWHAQAVLTQTPQEVPGNHAGMDLEDFAHKRDVKDRTTMGWEAAGTGCKIWDRMEGQALDGKFS